MDELKGEGISIYFASVEEGFYGHEAYADEEYINGMLLGAKEQDLNDMTLISSYSVHPNATGARVIAQYVQAKIDEITAGQN